MLPTEREGAELISSGSTTFWKRVFPTAWTLGLGCFVGALWLDLVGNPAAPDVVKGVFLGAWALSSGFFFRWFGQLQPVWLDGDVLIVGDTIRGTRVSLRDVREVKESRFQRLKTVTLELARPTPAGTQVTFVPRGSREFFLPWVDSPVAADLRERVERLGGPATPRKLHG